MIRQHLLYWCLYLLLLLVGWSIWLTIDHGDVVLLLSQNRIDVLDSLMRLITHAGEIVTFGFTIFFVLLINKRVGLVFVAGGVLQAIVTLFLKRIVFASVPRPTVFFGDTSFQLAKGVEAIARYSFPSGHTMTAFMLSTMVILLFNLPNWVQIVLLLIAIGVGFSRIYLGLHFMIDVLTGSMIGVTLALCSNHWIKPMIVKSEE
ncbi:MAG: phosphatase PAP2 family protein [Cyclobacteriaceae bacterium]